MTKLKIKYYNSVGNSIDSKLEVIIISHVDLCVTHQLVYLRYYLKNLRKNISHVIDDILINTSNVS